FYKPVRKNGSDVPMKEVEHPVIDSLKPHAKLVNAIPEVVGLGPSELVAKFAKSLNLYSALVLDLSGQSVEPFKKGNGSVIIPVKEYVRSRHPFLPLTMFAYLRTKLKVSFAVLPGRGGRVAKKRVPCSNWMNRDLWTVYATVRQRLDKRVRRVPGNPAATCGRGAFAPCLSRKMSTC